MTIPARRTAVLLGSLAGLVVLAGLCLSWTGCSFGPRLPRHAQGSAVLELRGAVRGGPFALGEADLRTLPRRAVSGVDPAASTPAVVHYAGLDLSAVLSDEVELSGDADTVILHTADGRAVAVPLSIIRELRPVLADHADDRPLGARLLAWPGAAQRGLASDPRAPAWWAHGVRVLEVVSMARTLGRALRLSEAAPPAARAGAALYADRCLACHRIRGRGGERGPELTRAADRLAAAQLRRRLAGHPGWTIPGQAEPTRQEADRLDAFLRAVAAEVALGREPADEEPPEPPPQREPPPLDGPSGPWEGRR